MAIHTSIAKDGTQVLVDPINRRIVAFVLAAFIATPLLVGVIAGFVGNVRDALALVSLALGAGAVAASFLLFVRVSKMTARSEAQIRIERAAATASTVLLKREVADPVGTALAALIDGIDVSAVFLETNTYEDADDFGNMPTVRDVLFASRPGDPGRWELTGWRVSEAAQDSLGSGLAFATVVTDLDSRFAALYRAARIGSEILVPITTEGRWVGSLGFSSADRDRSWTPQEIQLLRSTAESIGAFWERRDAKGRLEELLAAKDEFIASVSHEVRTPLTAVLGFAHELDEHIEKFSPEERSDLIGLIASQSREVANIVDDLLTAARAEAGTIVIAPQVLSVRTIVGEVLSSHSGRVDFEMADDFDIWADGGRVRQILRNLLTNADRYGGDIVRINGHRTDGQVRLEVRDNGEGVPAHLRDHVFEPYARAQNSSTQPASVGLGLSVARQLAQMMDGSLELFSEDDWTVFALCLPAAASVTELPQPVAS